MSVGITASALAQQRGVQILFARWQVAAGRVVFFAECTRQPLQITINENTVDALTALPVAAHERQWFTRAVITEVIIAHELFHLTMPAPSARTSHTANEEAAHAFAQRLTGLPFSPTYYETLLRREAQLA